MKALLLALVACLCLSGCAVEGDVYYPPTGDYQYGCVNLMTDDGEQEVCSQYYYAGGQAYYWDYGLGVWVGPGGYWRGGSFYRGGWYHGWGHWGYHGGYHGGGSFRGGYHG